MKKEYDFSKGKRGALDPLPSGKTRITGRCLHLARGMRSYYFSPPGNS